MNEPEFYKQANVSQRSDVKKLIGEFADALRSRSDGNDSLMDIGCGPGDVLMDFVVPILPRTYSRVMGTDISPKMIEYSKGMYAEHERVEFKVLDIETSNLPLEYHEQFDHVTSFFCLHWVQDQRQALKNIYKMLHQGGDCFLVFVSSSPAFDAFRVLSLDPKWAGYMKDVERFIAPLHNHPNPWLAYTKLFMEEGFADNSVEIRQKSFIFEGYESFRNHVISLTPFVQRIPLDQREEFKEDVFKQWKAICLCKKIVDSDECKYIFPYNLAVVYARK